MRIDRSRRYIVATDRLPGSSHGVTCQRIVADHGSVSVSVQSADGEHHSTIRAAARAFVRESMGTGWEILAYVGPEYYRREDGYDVSAARFSVISTMDAADTYMGA